MVAAATQPNSFGVSQEKRGTYGVMRIVIAAAAERILKPLSRRDRIDSRKIAGRKLLVFEMIYCQSQIQCNRIVFMLVC